MKDPLFKMNKYIHLKDTPKHAKMLRTLRNLELS